MAGKKMNKKTKMVLGKKKSSQGPKAKEVTRMGYALRALGGLGGGAIGSLFGMPGGGSTVGSSLGASLSKWLGSGDYAVGSNTIVNRTMKGTDSIPSMHNNGQSVIVHHKEFVTEVRGASAFTVRGSFDINPGRHETFPWLAGVAARFQEYRIKGLVWHYVPSSGAAVSGTNAALGTVMLQTSYRSNDTPPANKMEVLNEYWSSESVPSEAFCHPIECDPKENPFNVQYVRTDAVPSGDSKLLYDLGQTHLCVSGQQAEDTVLGDLWVTYEIELKKPIIESNVTSVSRCCDLLYNGTITASSYFNGTENRRGGLECSANVKTLSFPAQHTGTYLVTVVLKATTTFTVADMSGTATLVNCTNLPAADGSTYLRTNTGGTAPTINTSWYQIIINIPDKAKQASITFPNWLLTGGSTQSIITIAPFNVYT